MDIHVHVPWASTCTYVDAHTMGMWMYSVLRPNPISNFHNINTHSDSVIAVDKAYSIVNHFLAYTRSHFTVFLKSQAMCEIQLVYFA